MIRVPTPAALRPAAPGLLFASIVLIAGCASQDHSGPAATAPATQSALTIPAPDVAPAVSPMSERDVRRQAEYASAIEGVDFAGEQARVTDGLAGTAADRAETLAEAEAAVITGRETDAIAAYVRALRMDAADADAWAALAHTLALKGKLDASFASYNAAVELAPADADLRFDLAMKRIWTGDRPSAIAAFEDVLALDPQHGRAHVRLAVLHYYEGDLERSRRHVDAANRAGVAPPPQFLTLLAGAEAAGG